MEDFCLAEILYFHLFKYINNIFSASAFCIILYLNLNNEIISVLEKAMEEFLKTAFGLRYLRFKAYTFGLLCLMHTTHLLADSKWVAHSLVETL